MRKRMQRWSRKWDRCREPLNCWHGCKRKKCSSRSQPGMMQGARPSLKALGVEKNVPVVTRDQVAHAKPDPVLFLSAADRLGVSIHDSIVVGDSVWDLLAAQRARALGVGLASGGYGREELEQAGAYRTYDDPLDLMNHLDEIGVRTGRG